MADYQSPLDSLRAAIAAAGFTPAYCSVTVTSTSNTSAAAINPFDEDSHAAFTSVANVVAAGITFDETDGTFNIAAAGTYRIQVFYNLTSNTTTDNTQLDILLDAVSAFTTAIRVHSSVQPAPAMIEIFLTVTDGQDITTTYDSTGVAVINTNPGLTMNIQRIG